MALVCIDEFICTNKDLLQSCKGFKDLKEDLTRAKSQLPPDMANSIIGSKILSNGYGDIVDQTMSVVFNRYVKAVCLTGGGDA